jgi:hypothetical protein
LGESLKIIDSAANVFNVDPSESVNFPMIDRLNRLARNGVKVVRSYPLGPFGELYNCVNYSTLTL